MNFNEFLVKIGMPIEMTNWVENRTCVEFWQECERGDWMLYFMEKSEFPDKRAFVLAKVNCAALAMEYYFDSTALEVLELAKKFGLGLVDVDALTKATIDIHISYLQKLKNYYPYYPFDVPTELISDSITKLVVGSIEDYGLKETSIDLIEKIVKIRGPFDFRPAEIKKKSADIIRETIPSRIMNLNLILETYFGPDDDEYYI